MPQAHPHSRRSFLTRVAVLGAAGAVGFGKLSDGMEPASSARAFDLAAATKADFQAHLGSAFRVQRPSGETVSVELRRGYDRMLWIAG